MHHINEQLEINDPSVDARHIPKILENGGLILADEYLYKKSAIKSESGIVFIAVSDLIQSNDINKQNWNTVSGISIELLRSILTSRVASVSFIPTVTGKLLLSELISGKNRVFSWSDPKIEYVLENDRLLYSTNGIGWFEVQVVIKQFLADRYRIEPK